MSSVALTIDQDTGMIVSDDHALVPLSEVAAFLAVRPPIETAKDLRDRLAALCTYYRGKVDVYNELYEGQLRTERYIGQVIAEMPKNNGGRPGLTTNTVLVVNPPTLKDLGFTDMQSKRLQQLADVPEERFNKYIEAKKEAADRIVKADLLDSHAMSQAMKTLTSEETPEWYTPPMIVDRARRCLGGIDLDPASNATAQQWINAAAYYTADDNGLTQSWAGRVWLNPPFDDTAAWVDQIDAEYMSGQVTAAILLVNSAPGYNWWEDLWRRRPVCMLRERLCFVPSIGEPAGQAKKGQTIAYYGPDIDRFIEAFGDIGRIILPES